MCGKLRQLTHCHQMPTTHELRDSVIKCKNQIDEYKQFHILRLEIFIFLTKLIQFAFCGAVAEGETGNLRAKLLLKTSAGLQLRLESLYVRLQPTVVFKHSTQHFTARCDDPWHGCGLDLDISFSRHTNVSVSPQTKSSTSWSTCASPVSSWSNTS